MKRFNESGKLVIQVNFIYYAAGFLFPYFKDTSSRLTIDLFTFDRTVRPNVIYRTPVKAKLVDDFTDGYEAIPISVYNEIDDELPPKVSFFCRNCFISSKMGLDNLRFCQNLFLFPYWSHF